MSPSVFMFFFFQQFLQDLIGAVIQILVHRGRLQGWRPERMGDTPLGVKLLSEQMCSELKPSGNILISDTFVVLSILLLLTLLSQTRAVTCPVWRTGSSGFPVCLCTWRWW